MLVLGSASPRRAELLRRAGIRFEVDAPEVDETVPGRLSAAAAARAIARRKLAALVRRHPGRVVLTADTLIAAGRRRLGKPENPADARRMLAILSGRTHRVLTGVAVQPRRGRPRVVVVETRVTFVRLTPRQIRDYVASGEPVGKAGAYAIQGGAAAFVTGLQGDATNVMGLPLDRTLRMLARVGIRPGPARRPIRP